MKTSSVWFYGVVALASLGLAYFTWQRPQESESDSTIVLVDATQATFESLHVEKQNRVLDIYKAPNGGKGFWLDEFALDAPNAADAGRSLAPASTELRGVKASPAAESLMKNFMPLRAIRSLGQLSLEKMIELKVDDAASKLSIRVRGEVREFRYNGEGAMAMGGYLRDMRDNTTYVVDGATVSQLDPTSQQLVNRVMHSFQGGEFDSFEVALQGQPKVARRFKFEGFNFAQPSRIGPIDAPTKSDEFTKNWHSKISSLIVTNILSKGKEPPGSIENSFRISYLMGAKEIGFLELAKVSKNEVFAKSENFTGWVGIHTGAETLFDDAKKIAEGKTP